MNDILAMGVRDRVPPLVVIVGETASGKSALALELAEKFGGELICADSWTVYRGFDIGTAKPTSLDRARVPHHLLDVADPRDGFSAAVFQRLARSVITDIAARNKLPIMVGGTGLYIDSVLFSYSFLPPSDPRLREELNAMTLEQLIARSMNMELDITDIDVRNKRRVIRLIENNGVRPEKHAMRSNTLVLGTSADNDMAYARVSARVDEMLQYGLEAEVSERAKRYGWEAEPMKGIGYQEWQAYFEGVQDLSETRERIIKDTIDLAKRQRTWFKRNASIQWVSDRSNADELLTTFLNKTN
jgi:tRNA dimethylallyltransferase